MAEGVTTTVEELPESRVRVRAEVSPEEIEKRVAQAARKLGRNLRVPGFRPGKAPPPVVIQRIGRDAVLDEAVRDQLGDWYRAAIDDARIHPVGDPDIDFPGMPDEGAPLNFSIEIGVRPTARLGEYKGLEVGRPDADVDEADVDGEVERLRERSARLDTVERPAAKGDFVVMDYLGSIDGVPFPGGEGRDQMVELGSERLIPGFEEQLEGASGGDERTVTVTFPDDYGATELAGKQATFSVAVKEVKAKNLPELDDDFAVEHGFDDLDELKGDIRERLTEANNERLEKEFREAVLDAAVDGATVDVPDSLVEARARELWEQMLHTLSHQGISKDMYLRISGRSEDELVAETKPDAERQLKREAVLAAVAEAEAIEPSDEDLIQALAPDAEQGRANPKKLLERIRSAGRLDALREDVAHSKALDLMVESAKPIEPGRAEARKKIWTPGS